MAREGRRGVNRTYVTEHCPCPGGRIEAPGCANRMTEVVARPTGGGRIIPPPPIPSGFPASCRSPNGADPYRSRSRYSSRTNRRVIMPSGVRMA